MRFGLFWEISSVSWLLMPWCHRSLRNQQWWYCLCKIGRYFSSIRMYAQFKWGGIIWYAKKCMHSKSCYWWEVKLKNGHHLFKVLLKKQFAFVLEMWIQWRAAEIQETCIANKNTQKFLGMSQHPFLSDVSSQWHNMNIMVSQINVKLNVCSTVTSANSKENKTFASPALWEGKPPMTVELSTQSIIWKAVHWVIMFIFHLKLHASQNWLTVICLGRICMMD